MNEKRAMNSESQITASKVASFLNRFEIAQSTRSFANVVDMIHPNALFRFNDGDYRGLSSIQRAFENTWALDVKDEHYRLTNIEVISLDSNYAVATFQFNWSGKGPNGPFSIVGRGTSILVLHEGKLKVMVEHLSH